MHFRSPARLRASAFTLIELLTVIAIIAILMGLLFPALSIVRDQANKVRARTDLMGTVAAVKQYNTEYGKYPLTGANITTPADVTFGDAASGAAGTIVSNEKLYDVLRNYPNGNRPKAGDTPGDGNPRQIVFFEGKTGTATSANPRSGFATTANVGTGTIGAFYDPWGNQYAIMIDGDYDNSLKVPYTDFSGTGLNYGAVGWSVGKDGKLGTKGDNAFKSTTGTASDDIITWQ